MENFAFLVELVANLGAIGAIVGAVIYHFQEKIFGSKD